MQTDQNLSTEDLQVEIRELDKHLEALEQRGVELEGNLRDCKNGSTYWFLLLNMIHWHNITVLVNAVCIYCILCNRDVDVSV